MSTTTLHIRFTPVDTWFFREARPHDSVGSSRLQSQFPPPASSLMGTLRTRLGEVLGINWIEHAGKDEERGRSLQEFAGLNLSDLLGHSDDTGLLEFGAVEVWKGGERLLPVPAYLLKPGASSSTDHLLALQPGSPVVCDLSQRDSDTGRLVAVVMPELPKGAEGSKPLDNHWLPVGSLLDAALTGGQISKGRVVAEDDLFCREARLGIARDNKAGKVLDGMLYQTEHLRLLADVSLAIRLTLPSEVAAVLQASIQEQPLQRFGGEGRMAHLAVEPVTTGSGVMLKSVKADKRAHGLVLMLDADAEMSSTTLGLVPQFEACPETGKTRQVWSGDVNGVPVKLVTAVVGKAVRRGGWDLQKRRPKGMRSFIPAGSCWFVEIPGMEGVALNEVIPRLHGFKPGQNSLNGRGSLLVGLWNKR
jgi:CRISPR-associated protein Cmr3